MGSRHSRETGRAADKSAHFGLGLFICLLPFGVLQSVAHAGLVDIGDVGADDLVRP